MKTLNFYEKTNFDVDTTLVNTSEILDWINSDEFYMEIHAFGRQFKSYGHYKIWIETYWLNPETEKNEWKTFDCVTTNTADLDMFYSDEDSDSDEKASAFESLITEIIRKNNHLFV